MKRLILLSSIYVISLNSISQIRNDSSDILTYKKNTIYLELLGNSGLYSVNFDRMFFKKSHFSLSGRLGISYMPIIRNFSSATSIGVPLEINLLIGNRNHYLEIGSGFTYFYLFDSPTTSEIPADKSLSWFVPRVGYRFQLDDGGLFFRVGFTPLFSINKDVDPKFLPSGGISVGYTLK